MFNPPDYSAQKNFLNPKMGPWTVVLYMHRKKILNSLIKATPHLKGKLLDVGCGNKPYQSILPTDEYTGIDVGITPHDKNKVDLMFDGVNIPFGHDHFDSILCTEVLEHCTEPVTLLNEMYRVMKKDAFAFLSVPMFMEHHEAPYDFRRFTYYGIKKIADDAGFKIIFLEHRGNFLSVYLAAKYHAISQFISMRPLSDIIYWILFPFTYLIYKLDGLKKNEPVAVSLGWQILIKK